MGEGLRVASFRHPTPIEELRGASLAYVRSLLHGVYNGVISFILVWCYFMDLLVLQAYGLSISMVDYTAMDCLYIRELLETIIYQWNIIMDAIKCKY